MSNRTEKIEAQRVLGLRDEHFKNIPFEKRSQEALLETVALLQIRNEANIAAQRALEDRLIRKIKDLSKAKRLANKRADEAEQKLLKIKDTLV